MNTPRARLVSLCALLCLAPLVGACDVYGHFADGVDGNGIEVTEVRRVPSFSEVLLSGEGRVEVVIGTPQPIEITGDENLLRLVETTVDGETLHIRSREEIDPKVDLVLRVTTPVLRAVRCSGAGKVDVQGVDENDFVVDLSGAASIHLAGRVDRLELNVSGVGSIQAGELVAREVVIRVSGVGKAHVNATERLDARVSGVGRVTYAGDPTVHERVSGIGRISRRD